MTMNGRHVAGSAWSRRPEEFAATLADMAVRGDHDELVRFANSFVETEPALLARAVVGLAETCAHLARELGLAQAARFSRSDPDENGGS
jgi:hypothetical protein